MTDLKFAENRKMLESARKHNPEKLERLHALLVAREEILTRNDTELLVNESLLMDLLFSTNPSLPDAE